MKYLFAIWALAVLVGSTAIAQPVPELTEFTREQVVRLTEAVQSVERDDPSRVWSFKRFLLRIQAKVGFNLEAVNLELVPELELVWQKQPPR